MPPTYFSHDQAWSNEATGGGTDPMANSAHLQQLEQSFAQMESTYTDNHEESSQQLLAMMQQNWLSGAGTYSNPFVLKPIPPHPSLKARCPPPEYDPPAPPAPISDATLEEFRRIWGVGPPVPAAETLLGAALGPASKDPFMQHSPVPAPTNSTISEGIGTRSSTFSAPPGLHPPGAQGMTLDGRMAPPPPGLDRAPGANRFGSVATESSNPSVSSLHRPSSILRNPGDSLAASIDSRRSVGFAPGTKQEDGIGKEPIKIRHKERMMMQAPRGPPGLELIEPNPVGGAGMDLPPPPSKMPVIKSKNSLKQKLTPSTDWKLDTEAEETPDWEDNSAAPAQSMDPYGMNPSEWVGNSGWGMDQYEKFKQELRDEEEAKKKRAEAGVPGLTAPDPAGEESDEQEGYKDEWVPENGWGNNGWGKKKPEARPLRPLPSSDSEDNEAEHQPSRSYQNQEIDPVKEEDLDPSDRHPIDQEFDENFWKSERNGFDFCDLCNKFWDEWHQDSKLHKKKIDTALESWKLKRKLRSGDLPSYVVLQGGYAKCTLCDKYTDELHEQSDRHQEALRHFMQKNSRKGSSSSSGHRNMGYSSKRRNGW